jgi:hypothetical protein
MNRTENANEVLARAESEGVSLELASGLTLARGDMQPGIAADLVKHLRNIRRLLELTAIAARGNELAGQRILSEDGSGLLVGASSDGSVTISVIRTGVRNPLTLTSDVGSLLVTGEWLPHFKEREYFFPEVDGYSRGSRMEELGLAVHTPGPETLHRNANELVQLSEKAGLRPEFDCGFIRVQQTRPRDPESLIPMIAELWTHHSALRALLERRATAARAKEFVGQKVLWEGGEGVLLAGSTDGPLMIEIQKDGASRSQSADARLLIVLDERTPHIQQPTSEQPRRGFFERLRGSRDE